jgi:hypothetical protein
MLVGTMYGRTREPASHRQSSSSPARRSRTVQVTIFWSLTTLPTRARRSQSSARSDCRIDIVAIGVLRTLVVQWGAWEGFGRSSRPPVEEYADPAMALPAVARVDRDGAQDYQEDGQQEVEDQGQGPAWIADRA